MIDVSKLIGSKSSEFDIWVSSDNHNGVFPSNETALAVSQIDSEQWDIGINLGDVNLPDTDGNATYLNYISQYDGLVNHNLNQIYHFGGNHDRTKASDPAGEDYYQKQYINPVVNGNNYYDGQPFTPIGTYDAYYLSIGNMIIINITDRNGGLPPAGEDGLGSGTINFRASGNISTEQWEFLKDTVQSNTDKIIIVGTHQGIKDTTIATGWKEFNQAFSRDADYDPTGINNPDDSHRGGYIAYINNAEGTVNETTGDSDATNEIKTWLETYGQYIDLWVSGHYHRKLDDTWEGRTRYEQVYGCNFLNCSVMNSKLHNFYNGLLEVKSNILSIRGDIMTVKTYIHKDPNSAVSVGFYEPEEFEITLKRRFRY